MAVKTSLEDWQIWIEKYTMLPVVMKYPLEMERIPSWERAWESASDCSFVLESGKAGRYSYLGLEPFSTIRGKGDQAVVTSSSSSQTTCHGKPLPLVKQWMEPYRSPKLTDIAGFIGGCVGYWSYDVNRSIEKLPTLAMDDLPCPDYYFMMVDELWIIDHQEQTLYCAVHTMIDHAEKLEQVYEQALHRVAQMKARWDRVIGNCHSATKRVASFQQAVKQDNLQIDVEAIDGIETIFHKNDYMNAVRQIQQYIREGDVFQVNLSLRQSRPLYSTPENIYEWLRLTNPSPYMGLLRFPDFKLVSASPELLVKLDGDEVSTRPIAGTRRRGVNPQDDRDMANELLLSEKERSEHIMLLDLERNDLGRISRYGSVHVSEFMVIEYYSHVMHIVSEVRGRLAEGKDAFDVIAATFPGGTITGAPKIRTMEIIEELEPVRRGPYTGSMGWIDYNGNMEFNIIIRTLLVSDGLGHIQAGAGIVIDSDPAREYKESLNKAKALWKAIVYSEQNLKEAGRG